MCVCVCTQADRKRLGEMLLSEEAESGSRLFMALVIRVEERDLIQVIIRCHELPVVIITVSDLSHFAYECCESNRIGLVFLKGHTLLF